VQVNTIAFTSELGKGSGVPTDKSTKPSSSHPEDHTASICSCETMGRAGAVLAERLSNYVSRTFQPHSDRGWVSDEGTNGHTSERQTRRGVTRRAEVGRKEVGKRKGKWQAS